MTSNTELINNLISVGALKEESVIHAFLMIDRADFVADPTASDAYEDYPLSIGYGQTISQPRTVAMMMEMLGPKEGEKILDIGSGSGWTSAILGFIVGEEGSVTGTERVSELLEFAKANVAKYGLKNTNIIQAKDELGAVGEEFDRILVSASASAFPYGLIEQVKVGGKLVIPVGHSIYEVTKNANGEVEGKEHYGFKFVPLIFQNSRSV